MIIDIFNAFSSEAHNSASTESKIIMKLVIFELHHWKCGDISLSIIFFFAFSPEPIKGNVVLEYQVHGLDVGLELRSLYCKAPYIR